MTPGVDGHTYDGFNMKRVDNIITALKSERYKPKPTRMVSIPKKNGRYRKLGIPTSRDKLLQYVIKEVLETIYLEKFSPHSHGYMPHKGAHTAIQSIKSK